MAHTETLHKKLIRLVLPISFQQFMLALVGASDTFMLGRLNQNSMSAVSLASQITFVFNLFMAAFVIGENMFVAQYYGKKDYDNISRVFHLVLWLSCSVAILFVIGAMCFPKTIMLFFTNDHELVTMGSEYLKYVGISYLLSAVAQVYLTLMKNCGAVNLSTVIGSVAVILNIMLNAVFIFGLFGFPSMGIKGAALATVVSTAVQMVWCIGLGNAGSIIIGNELGANHFAEAKRAGRVLTRASILCGLLSGVVLLALSPVIMKFVNLTPTAMDYLRNMLLICSCYLVGKSVNSMTIGGIFLAGGDSKFGLICDIVTL